MDNVATYEVNTARMCVTLDGVHIQLAASEFRLLVYLLKHPGHSSQQQIAQGVFGDEMLWKRVRTYICRLRKKIGKESIETLYTKGYALVEHNNQFIQRTSLED